MTERGSLRRLTNFEITVHGLVDGIALYLLLSQLWPGRPVDLFQDSFALLVLLLSWVVAAGRFRPESRGLRILGRGLSILVTALGGVGLVLCLLLIVSSALYKGPSPDAGGMGVMVGVLLFYPMEALLLLPFALDASRLAPHVRWRYLLLGLGLALLPPALLLGLTVIHHVQQPAGTAGRLRR